MRENTLGRVPSVLGLIQDGIDVVLHDLSLYFITGVDGHIMHDFSPAVF